MAARNASPVRRRLTRRHSSSGNLDVNGGHGSPPPRPPMHKNRWVAIGTYVTNCMAGWALTQILYGAVAQSRYGFGVFLLTLWPRLNRASYLVLRWPLLVLVYALIGVELLIYGVLRMLVAALELAVASPTHRRLRSALRRADDYASWLECARALDVSRGVALWQADLRSTRYNWPFVRRLRARLSSARRCQDWRGVAETLRLCSRPNVGGIMAPELFAVSYAGAPKIVVTDFVDEVGSSIDWLARTAASVPLVSPRRLSVSPAAELAALGTLNEDDENKRTRMCRSLFGVAREAYGATALALSGGGALGTYHFGVVRALHDARLLPEAICGTSAGSIVASFCCCRNDSELERDLYDDGALSRNLKCFESTPLECLKRLYNHGACYDPLRWMVIARWFANDSAIENMTFLEAFERSGRALAITVCATGKKAPPVLLTHKTSPHVVIISAIVATSAVPRLLPPQVLLEKDPMTGALRPQAGSELHIDGSIAHDIPAAALREAFNARFIVASQVNPHMQPMFYHAHGSAGEPCRWGSVGEASWRGGYALAALELFLRKDMAAKLEFLRDVDATPGWSGRVFTQSPKGCVTITPKLRWYDGFRLFSNPTPASLRRDCREGRVATYQKLAMLRTRVHVERALRDACVMLAVDRGADRTQGSLAWATPQTLADFPDVVDTTYDSGADFADDGL